MCSSLEDKREKGNPSPFTLDERDLFDDLLCEYTDKYHMAEMPVDYYGMHYFDSSLERTQYLVQRLYNIGIDIESNVSDLTEEFNDIKGHFLPRVERFGYKVFHHSLKTEGGKRCISITIMKK